MRLRRFPMKEGQGMIGHAMRNNEALSSSDSKNDPRRDPHIDEIFGFECTTCMAVPLEGEGGTPMGAMALYNKRTGKGFSDDDQALLALLAANASTAIRLQQSRESREREERLTAIGRLLSGVIHDLKTPLTVISGYVQLMQQAEKQEQRDEYAELVLKQFDHISAMQRDVLEFARGEKTILMRKVYLAKFFADVKTQLEAQLAYRDIELVVDVQDKGTARFDEGKILRVVHNLARNAADAMADKGGKFVIRVTREPEVRAKGAADSPKGTPTTEDVIVITFSDTGPGIPKEIEHRLFQSFVTSGKKGGTGVGRANTKKNAEEHGGANSVQSSKSGATFKLRLPQRP
jgi:signal transduction histidine kinase